MLKRKRKTKAPCPGCFLHQTLCICDVIPRLQLRTKVSLVVHAKELKRTTNTGRLAIQALQNSEMFVRGLGRESLDLSSLLDEQYQPLLFYPAEEARELTKEFISKMNKPIHLIVPDGNWRQASKVQTRHPELADVPRVKISAPNLATLHMRTETTEEGMATLEAIAHALRIIDGEEAYEGLIKLYHAKLTGTLRGRGLKIADQTEVL